MVFNLLGDESTDVTDFRMRYIRKKKREALG